MTTNKIASSSSSQPAQVEEHGDIELRVIDIAPSAHREDATSPTANLEMNRDNVLKIVVAGFPFFFAGTNDGSLGALTPYILRTYHMGTQYVALMYDSVSV